MKHQKIFHVCMLYIVLSLCLIITMLIALTIGTVELRFSEIISVIISQVTSGTAIEAPNKGAVHDIIWLLRMPRIILAMIVGMGLSVCGVIMQAVVKNPLADPYILGVSSGATLGATSAILLGVGIKLGADFVGIAAFGGAFLVSLAVLFIANVGGQANSVKLLLAGIALSAVCSAFSSFIVYFANNKDGIQNIIYWLMGSFAGAKWSTLIIICPLIVVCIAYFWSQSRILNLMLLGDESAITLGTDLHFYRQIFLLVSSLIVGFVVYTSGMIGFVGLIIPHVVRMLVGTDHRKVLPLSALCGAIFLVFSDALCRVLLTGTELPIGILISLIGAPFFVYLMVKKTYGFGGQ